MDTDADIDAAAEDPPVFWLAVSVAGLVLAGGGLILFVLDLLGFSGSLLAVAPFLAPIVGLSPFVTIFGVLFFVFAMTEWDPDVES